jgi:hypothetical protein
VLNPQGPPAGEVVFDNVQFRLQPDREILKGVSFTVPAGQGRDRRADRRRQIHDQPAAVPLL